MNSFLHRIICIARRHPLVAARLLQQSGSCWGDQYSSCSASERRVLFDSLYASLQQSAPVAASRAMSVKSLLDLSSNRLLEKGEQREVLQLIADASLDILHINCSAIWLFDESSGQLACHALGTRVCPQPHLLLERELQEQMFGCLKDVHDVLIVGDVHQQALHTLSASVLQQAGVFSMMGISLRMQGECVGMLFFGHSEQQSDWSHQEQLLGRHLGHLVQQILGRDVHLSLQHQLEQHVQRRTAELQQQTQQLEQAQRNICMLSEIGREITSSLDREIIMDIVYRHVHDLLGAEVFAVGLYRPDEHLIEFPCNILQGEHMQAYTRDVNDSDLLSVWCVLHQKEIFINDIDAEYAQYISVDGLMKLTVANAYPDGVPTIFPRSHIYVPMVIKNRTIGLIAMQSTKKNAFHRMHLDMAMTLAAYTAIAIDNADTYQQLVNAQQILVSQEKLAALGSLVAGIAHELNTPIGNSLLTATTLQSESARFMTKFTDNALRRSDLNTFCAVVNEANDLLIRNLTNASDLVSSFKQVSVDQTSQQRRVFNLAQTTHEVVRTLHNQIHKQGHVLEMDIPNDITMDSYPGPYGQIVTNFIINAMLHGFDHMQHGKMVLSAKLIANERVQLVFSDNGCGIPVENLRRIFDPFFTTKLGRGGSGLGLSIVHNLVSSIMGGKIDVLSTAGKGTRFTLILPLHP